MLRLFDAYLCIPLSPHCKALILLLLALLTISSVIFGQTAFSPLLPLPLSAVVSESNQPQGNVSPLESPLLTGGSRQLQQTATAEPSLVETAQEDSPLVREQRQSELTSSPMLTVTIEPTPTAVLLPTATATLSIPITLTTPAPTFTSVLTPTATTAVTATPIPNAAEAPSERPVVGEAVTNPPTAESTATGGQNDLAEVVIGGQAENDSSATEAALISVYDPLESLFSLQNLILGLLCLIFLSINGLGLTALIVTLFYVRSRREQPYP